jgi:hypothetical protein
MPLFYLDFSTILEWMKRFGHRNQRRPPGVVLGLPLRALAQVSRLVDCADLLASGSCMDYFVALR